MASHEIFKLQLCIKVHRLNCLSQLLQDLTQPCGQRGLAASRYDRWWSLEGSVLKPWESQAGKLCWKDLSAFNNTLVRFLKALSSTWFCGRDFLWVYNSLKCMVSSSHNLHRLSARLLEGFSSGFTACVASDMPVPRHGTERLRPSLLSKWEGSVLFTTHPCWLWDLVSLLSNICSGFPFRTGRSMSFSFFSFSVLK